ncbi:MAG: tRNA pseudouridine(55) synthase TruB [Ignavibacteria bacterium RBG_16_34_14]|nr:MAG: tRNA pseudouridine(55) synthase TruB [Ignavibacteria bacterium RBG_16_34_14]
MITKRTDDLSGIDFRAGEIILVDKPAGWSSFKVIRKVRNAIGVKKVGHAGTLDPMATGLLIVATGKKTKSINEYQALEKTYTGTITLGKTSPSMDLETEITSEKSFDHISEEDIDKVRDEFIGRIKQIPPMYSAVKYKGKSLYHLARKGKVVERSEREVTVYDFIITKINLPDVDFEITCSKGTYIRAIADDFGKKLGCGGLLSSLRRTKIGSYSVEDTMRVDEFIEKLTTKYLQ